MIIVRMTSGLGNQMFQYALVELLRERYPGVTVKMDVTWFYANDEHQGFELERLFAGNGGYRGEYTGFWDYVRVRGRIPTFVKGPCARAAEELLYYPNRFLRLFTEKSCQKTYVNQLAAGGEPQIHYLLTHLDTSLNWYVEGFFIEEIYYRDRLKRLWELFRFDEGRLDADNRKLLTGIRNSQSVSLHVRRGDYLGKYAGKFLSLPMEYYQKCVSYLRERVENPHFYLFSDDKAYVEQAFGWLSDKTVVTGNTGRNSYVDMELMSACKHNILANSTFSTWGALLNQNERRIVLYPRQYMSQKDNETKTIRGWTMVDFCA